MTDDPFRGLPEPAADTTARGFARPVQPVSAWSVQPGGTYPGGASGTVVFHLNSPTFSMTPDSARRFAEALTRYADQADDVLERAEVLRRRDTAHRFPCRCEPAPASVDPCRHSDSSLGCPRHDFDVTGDDARAEVELEHPEAVSATRGITRGGDR